MATELVHHEHFYDRAPLCWSLDQVASDAPRPAMSTKEPEVTCPECIAYMIED